MLSRPKFTKKNHIAQCKQNILVGHVDVCFVTCQRMTIAYGGTQYETRGIPRAEIKVTEEVKSFKKQINT